MRGIGMIPFLIACASDNIIEKQDNALPTILITSHSDGVEVQDSYIETFRATASDEDHDLNELSVIWYVGESVACDWETVSPDGTSVCEIVFVEGDENVIAEVRDPSGAAAVANISVSVLPTEAPIVEIIAPETTGNYYSDNLIQFSALVTDAEDDTDDLLIVWSSSIEGDLSLDSTADSSGELSDFTYLQEGEHAIELRVEDSSGKVSTDSVVIDVRGENNIPFCEITEPVDGSAFVVGDMITFRGIGTDQDIPNNQLLVEWISDKDGTFGTSIPSSAGEITFSASELSSDAHTISLNVSDEIGAICTSQILIHIGNLPIANIDNPLDGEIFSVGEAISFQGTATDQEDQPNEISVVWTSSIDGELEAGNVNSQNISEFVSDSLTPGLHSLDFTITDSVGLTDQDSVSFRVNTPPEIDSLNLFPDPIYTGDDLTMTFVSSDADGHTVIESIVWYEDGVLTSFNGSSISASELDVGETWTVRVTPNDGYVDGIYAEEMITISNTDPVITVPVISSSDGSDIYNNSVLTCSATASDSDELVNPSYSWSVGSSNYNGPTLDLSNTSISPMSSIECVASVADSNGGSASASTTVTIDNRTPMVDSMTISPDPTYWDQDMTIEATFVDFDGDNVTASYVWHEEGVVTAYTGDTIPASELEPGEEWTVYITPNDGHENGNDAFMVITIDNYTPSVDTVLITPNTDVTTDSELLCSGTGSDPEDGSLSPTYEWYVNANLLGTTDILQLDNSMVSPSDWVECVATVVDSLGESTFAVGLAQVENSAPIIDSLLLSPSSVNPTEILTCSAFASDIDGDIPSLSFVFTNLTTSTTHAPTSATSTEAQLDLSTIAINPNEEIQCVVTATDSSGEQTSDSASVTMEWDVPSIVTSVLQNSSYVVGDTLTCTGTASDYAGNDLSAQIQYQWLNASNGNTLLSTATDYTIDASQAGVGDVINCVGTVTDSFGEVASAVHNNGVVSVMNSPPVFTVTPALSSYTLYQGDTVTCSAMYSDPNDPNLSELLVEYLWVNVSQANQVITTGTDTYIIDLNDISIESELRCIVTITDPQGEMQTEESPAAMIQNASPVISNLQITPNTDVNLGTELTCSAMAIDAEMGQITPTYQWIVGNTLLNTSNIYTVDASQVNIGDTLTCQVEAHDGYTGVIASTSVLIENIPPTVSNVVINSDSGLFYNDEVLTCTATTDDAETMPIVSYSWESAGSILGSAQTLDLSIISILPNSSITCTVTVDDSYDTASDAVTETLGNRAPTLSTPALSNYAPYPVDTITCSSILSDADGELLSESYAWEDNSSGSFIPINGEISSSLDVSSLGLNAGSELRCVVSVSDNYGGSAEETSPSATIENTPPVFDIAVSIFPATAYTETELTCSATGSDYEDGSLMPSYSWTINGSEVSDQPTYTVSSSDSDVADELICIATVSDAAGASVESTGSVFVENTAPTASNAQIVSSSGNYYNDEVLFCSATTADIDMNSITSYEWTSGGSILGMQYSLDLSTTSLLPSDSLTCTVTEIDSMGEEASVSTTEIMGDRAPTTPVLTISWLSSGSDPIASDDLICSATSADPDGTSLIYSYSWTSDAGGSVGGDTVPASVTSTSETWTCSTTVTDGTGLSSSNTTSRTVISQCFVTGCDDSVDLGNNFGIDLVNITAGTFTMGGVTHLPYTTVTLTNDFLMSTTEITQGMWYELMGFQSYDGKSTTHNLYGSYGVGSNHPAFFVSWQMAASFTNALTQHHNSTYGTNLQECYSCTGSGTSVTCSTAITPVYQCTGYRLPTNAEWEYAAKAGTTNRYWTPNGGSSWTNSYQMQDGYDYRLYAHFGENNTPYGTKEVALLAPNDNGLYDMSGNVNEHNHDILDDMYVGNPETDLVHERGNPHSMGYKAMRGGGFSASISYVAVNYFSSTGNPNDRGAEMGFRIVRTN